MNLQLEVNTDSPESIREAISQLDQWRTMLADHLDQFEVRLVATLPCSTQGMLRSLRNLTGWTLGEARAFLLNPHSTIDLAAFDPAKRSQFETGAGLAGFRLERVI